MPDNGPYVDGEFSIQPLVREVACPRCGAEPGQFCETPSMVVKHEMAHHVRYLRWVRRQLAREKAAAGSNSTCDPAP